MKVRAGNSSALNPLREIPSGRRRYGGDEG
jgi:hypothetical protein